MPFNHEKGLDFTNEELIRRALAILPHRDQYFMDMLKQFKLKFPGVKVFYANTKPGQQLNPEHPTPDFIIILKGRLVSNDPRLPPKNIILFDIPMIFTDRSIAGWTLAVERGKKNAYFDYMMDKMCRIPENRFAEYLVHMAYLSLDKNEKRYWKNPENQDELIRELMELYMRFAKKNDHSKKIRDVSGYGATPT